MYAEEPFEPKLVAHYLWEHNQLEAIKNPICIIGVPDLSNLGQECINYLITELKAEKIAIFYCSDFPPISYIEKNSYTLDLTKIEFYLVQNFKDQKNLLLITGTDTPKSPIGLNYLAEKIVEFIIPMGPEVLIALATFPSRHPTHARQVFLTVTSDELLPLFKIDKKTTHKTELGLQLLQKGIVLGLNSLVVAYAKEFHNLLGGILLAETEKSETTDLIAVKALLNVISTVFELPISLVSLNSNIKTFLKEKSTPSSRQGNILKDVRKRIQN